MRIKKNTIVFWGKWFRIGVCRAWPKLNGGCENISRRGRNGFLFARHGQQLQGVVSIEPWRWESLAKGKGAVARLIKEPPYAGRHVRWSWKVETGIISFLLLDYLWRMSWGGQNAPLRRGRSSRIFPLSIKIVILSVYMTEITDYND